ncbi:MAG: DUF11 domain-containing protein [Pirellulaceae bacterium]|nr:DUF11 domain-containing protein [Pirellulaceae bacterium]
MRSTRRSFATLFRQLLERVFPAPAVSRKRGQRRLRLEPLEGRALMATDLASVTGIVTLSSAVSGATVNLYQDDGDGIFESASDTLLDTDSTDGTGRYRFDRLAAGGYWIQQPAQAGLNLGESVSPLVTISALQAQGIAGLSIDDFADAVAQTITANSGTPTVTGSADHVGALGGERDLLAQLTSGGAGESVTFDSQANRLLFDSTTNAKGHFVATYDGNDNDAAALAFGLAADLTSNGASNSIQVIVRADQANSTVKLRVYTDATHFSDSASFTVPGTNNDTAHVFEFADFTTGTGAAGAATFTSIGAIELIIDTGTDGTDGRVTLLGAYGPTVLTQNISNNADLSLTKVKDIPSPNVGQNVTFTITVTNSASNAGATGIVVTDVIPTGMSFVSKLPSQGTYDETTGVWTVGSLASGAGANLQIVAKLNSSAAITNTAEITAANQPDPDSTVNNQVGTEDDQASVAIDAPAAADLRLAQQVSTSTPTLNQQVTFTLTLTNDGPDQATAIIVEDQLPTGLTFVSKLPSQGTYDESTGVWDVGTLASGANVTLAIVATVTSSAAITNTAEVTDVDQFDPDSTPDDGAGDDFASATVDVPNLADLSLTNVPSSATPNLGTDVTFTVTVTNGGPDIANSVVVRDQLPTGLTFVSKNPSQGTYDETTGIWTVGNIAASGTATLTIVATVNSTAALSTTAEITASGTPDSDSTPNNNLATEDDQATATIDAPAAADLSVTNVPSNATPNLGANVTFTVTVTNSGPDAATGVVVTDQLPAGLTFVSKSPSQGTYDEATGIWTVGGINASANATLTIVATVNSTAALATTAQVTASGVFDRDSTPNNNVAAEDDQATATVDAPAASDLSITNVPSSTTPNFRSNVTYTVTVTNGGPDAATGVVVTDLLPTGLTFISKSPSQGTYDEVTGVWTVGGINASGTATLTIVARVDSTAALVTTAQVTASGTFDRDSTPNNNVATEDDQASATVDAPAAADLSISNVPSSNTPNFKSNVTYTVTLTNGGPDAATGVTVKDQLPTGLTFVSATPSVGTYVSSTGVWTVGTVNSGASPTLTIVATVNSTAAITTTAQVTASGLFDPDSTPNNNAAGEDDQASSTIDAPSAADIRLALTSSNPRPGVGTNVTFTVTVTNDGPDQATNVAVNDLLPTGLTFVSSTASQGSYVSGTGVWTVGTLNSGGAATLSIVATKSVAGAVTNTAQVTASDQFDPDSTVNNGAAGEDDRATSTLNQQRVSKRRFVAR